MNLKSRKHLTGQSVPEYVLPIALIGVLAIFSLSAMGNTVQGIFAGMIQDNGSGGQGLPQVDVGGSAGDPIGDGSSGGSIGQGGKTQPPGQAPLVITLSDGTKITLETYPENLKELLDVVAANGRLDFPGLLMGIANDMLAKGQLTTTQYNGLQAIANGATFTLDGDSQVASENNGPQLNLTDGGQLDNQENPPPSENQAINNPG